VNGDVKGESNASAGVGRQLAGRVAIVTGAAGGIGSAIAAGLAREGAALVLSDVNDRELGEVERRLRESGSSVVTIPGDLSEPETAEAISRVAVERFGRIDVLVNAAGVIKNAYATEMSAQDWHAVINIDLTAVFLSCRAVLPSMIAQRWGRIVNVSSQLALTGAEGFSAYCAAKAGVIAMSKSFAREVGRHGITVNCVAPGPVDTAMLAHSSHKWTPDRIAELPLGRVGSPEEVVPSVLLLVTEPGGNLFTGQTLSPNCGDVMH
jgi:3-oxoacyl-[acyl-carrier protein] reductase